MEKLKSLWEKVRGPGQGSGLVTTIHPTLNDLASKLGKAGIGTESLEELVKASHEKHLFSTIAEKENEEVTQGAEIMKQLKLHHDDEADEPAVTKRLTEKVGKHTVSDRELAAKRNALQVKAKKRELKTAKHKAKKSRHIYKGECDAEGLQPTGKKLASASGLIFYLAAVAIFGVEAAANFQAFLKVFTDDIVSTAVVAFGTSLGVTMMGKFCGAALASFKNQKARKLIPISIFVVALVSAIVFSVLIGGTRAYGDPTKPLSSIWSELGALAVNVFLFLCMIASTWSFQTKKTFAETINPLIDEKLKWEQSVVAIQKEIDELELSGIDKEIEIEEFSRKKVEEAENHVRNQGLEVAKRFGKYQAIIASINRQARIVGASLNEAIWGIRLHYLLATKSNGTHTSSPIPPKVALDPMLYETPSMEPSSKPNAESHTENLSPNPSTHGNVL
jgi:hypothetical protein